MQLTFPKQLACHVRTSSSLSLWRACKVLPIAILSLYAYFNGFFHSHLFVFCCFSCVHFSWWTCLWAIPIFICRLHLVNGNFCVIFINVYCRTALRLIWRCTVRMLCCNSSRAGDERTLGSQMEMQFANAYCQVRNARVAGTGGEAERVAIPLLKPRHLGKSYTFLAKLHF